MFNDDGELIVVDEGRQQSSGSASDGLLPSRPVLSHAMDDDEIASRLITAAEANDTATVLALLARLRRTQDLNTRDDNGRTLLHYAAMHANVDVITAVYTLATSRVDGGVNVNAVNGTGLTPVHCAACPCPTPSADAATAATGGASRNASAAVCNNKAQCA